MIKPYYSEPNIQIYNGDCLEVMKELPDKSIDLIVTDPPYGLNYRSNWGSKTGNLKDYIENDKPEEFISLIQKVMPEFKRLLKTDSEVYWFCGGGGQPVLAYAWLEFVKHKPDLRVKNLLVWDKQFVGLGWDWRFQYETIFQLVKGKGINISKNRNRSNILKCNNLIPQAKEHPTVKPVALINELLKEKSWGGGNGS